MEAEKRLYNSQDIQMGNHKAKKPNILMIMTDHQRYDSIGKWVDGIEVTPNLNRLKKDSMSFERAYNTCPLCVPARTALATGAYPTANGVVYNDWAGETATDSRTIHADLSDSGYKLYHSGVDHLKVTPGLRQQADFTGYVDQADFQKHVEEAGADMSQFPKHKKKVLERYGEDIRAKTYSNTDTSVWDQDTGYYRDTYFTEKATDFIRNETEPFALFLNYWAPHPPLIVPDSFWQKFKDIELVLPDNIGRPSAGEPENRRMSVAAQLAEGITEEEWTKVWKAHLALVNYVDNEIGIVLDVLKDKGIYEDTIIIFTSDHGDHLGQHGMYQKMEMYEEAVHVPLLIKAPTLGIGSHKGVVSHLDIVPTVMEAVNTSRQDEINKSSTAGQLDGESLYNIVNDPKNHGDRLAFIQYSGNPAIGSVRRAVVSKNYKYIIDDAGHEELYDLSEDPSEMFNLINDTISLKGHTRETLTIMRNECRLWASEKKDWVKL